MLYNIIFYFYILYFIFIYLFIYLFIFYFLSHISFLFLHLSSPIPHTLTSPHSPTFFPLLSFPWPFLDSTPRFFFVSRRPTHFFGEHHSFSPSLPSPTPYPQLPFFPFINVIHHHRPLIWPHSTPNIIPSLSLSRFPFLLSFGYYGLHLLDLIVEDASTANLHLPMLRSSLPPLLSRIVAFCLQS